MHEIPHARGQRLRVFILEGYGPVLRGLRYQLEAGGFDVVGSCASAAEAAPLILALRPDVAILGVRAADGNGLDVLRSVHAADQSLRCLMLDTVADEGAERSARAGGANGYLLKQIDGHPLAEALHRVAAGESLFAA